MPAEKKPCPFCGLKPVLVSNNVWEGVDKSYVKCDYCNSEGPRRDTDELAVEAWNRRADTVECANLQAHNNQSVTALREAFLCGVMAERGKKGIKKGFDAFIKKQRLNAGVPALHT